MNQNTSEAVGRMGFKDVALASSGGWTRTEKRILHERGSTICPISQLRGLIFFYHSFHCLPHRARIWSDLNLIDEFWLILRRFLLLSIPSILPQYNNLKVFWQFEGIKSNKIQFRSWNTSCFTLKFSQKMSFLDF